MDRAKELILEKTGIPGSHVIISATHTHSTPRAVVGLVDNDLHREYLDQLGPKIADGVQRAHENLAPAKIGWASAPESRHVHNRRWFVEGGEKNRNPFGETGEKVSMNPGRKGLIKPAGPADPEVYVLSIQSAKDQPVALLGNYGLHYVGGTGRGKLSADYYGVFANLIQEKLGANDLKPPFVGIMSNGTSGDVNANDLTQPSRKWAPYERINYIAGHVADAAFKAYQTIEYNNSIDLAAAEKILRLKVRKPNAERLEWARQTVAPAGTPLRLSRPQVYAREALALAEYPDEVDVRIQAFRIGKLGIVSIPNEVFAETGLAIKKESPFESTFVIELANGYHGYLPTPQQHEWGGYETWPARSAYLEVGAETSIRKTGIELLNQLQKK